MPKSPLNDMAGRMSYQGSGSRSGQNLAKEVLPSFQKILTARRSIRVYDETPIPEQTMQECIWKSILAPSSSNLQPYQLLWIRDPDKKKLVAAACLGQPAATTAAELVVVTARRDLWDTNRKKLIKIMTDDGKKQLPPPVDAYYNKLIPKIMADDFLGVFNFMRRVGFF